MSRPEGSPRRRCLRLPGEPAPHGARRAPFTPGGDVSWGHRQPGGGSRSRRAPGGGTRRLPELLQGSVLCASGPGACAATPKITAKIIKFYTVFQHRMFTFRRFQTAQSFPGFRSLKLLKKDFCRPSFFVSKPHPQAGFPVRELKAT